ncbi:MAG: M48 family metalloprotease [Alphaproteobacteria bacterium]|nr:M48 family metalloprotease [Alphaproteobacteria bacterium]
MTALSTVVLGPPPLAAAALIAAAVFLSGLYPIAAQAQGRTVSLIRDTEIENTIRVYTAPIFKAAGLNPSFVRIHLVNDPSLNAFVANGQRIYIHTGLLMRADNPGQVIGVLAHEAGHITGGHLARFSDGLSDASNTNLAALILGIPLAVLSGRPEVAAAASSLGNQLGTRQFLQYTRGNERAADQAAVDFLDEAEISARGLYEFMQVLQQQDAMFTSTSQSSYTRTHPLSADRVEFLRNHLANSPNSRRPLPDYFQRMHDRMRAKLNGYILPTGRVYTLYPETDRSFDARYARAVALMRDVRTEEALVLAEELIAENPEDAFVYELKADILRDAARLEDAIDVYERVVEMLPWAALVRLELARSQIELNSPDLDDEAEIHLREALRYEPNMSQAWRLLATVYGRRGDFGQTALAQAEEAVNQGRRNAALGHARRALTLLPEGSPAWLRAQDIEIQAQRNPNG